MGGLWADLIHYASKLPGWWTVERDGFEGGGARAPGEEVRQRPYTQLSAFGATLGPLLAETCGQPRVANMSASTAPSIPSPGGGLSELCVA